MLFSPSLKAKKQFVAWLIKNYSIPKRETLWILNYLLNHDLMLKHVHFVEGALETPRGMLLVSDVPDEESFIFCKDGQRFTNPEQAFHDLRLRGQGECYISLGCLEAYQILTLFGVLEDNPYVVQEIEVSDEIEEQLSNFSVELLALSIEKAIDKALEEGDRERFYRLSEKLQKLR